MWLKAGAQIKQKMLFQPMAPDNSDLLFPGVLSGTSSSARLDGSMEHLSCYLGGVFALSSKLFADPSELSIAAKLTQGCVWAYGATPFGIMPEAVDLFVCRQSLVNCPWNEATFSRDVDRSGEEAGIFLPPGFARVGRPEYILRPEAIESVFIMYRITGDNKWREKGWQMFQSIQKVTRATLWDTQALKMSCNHRQPTPAPNKSTRWKAFGSPKH